MSIADFILVLRRLVGLQRVSLSPLGANAGLGGQVVRSSGLVAGSPGIALGIRPLVRWVGAVVLVLLVGVAVGRDVVGNNRGASVVASRGGEGLHHLGLSSLPLTAQGVVSAALGGNDRAYRLSRMGSGYWAANPAQHLSARFEPGGLSVWSDRVRLGLRLGAVGYGGSLVAVAQAVPRARGNRVVYEHEGLSEWYANGPLGIEQGFTLARAPAGDAKRPLTLTLAFSGNAHASVEAGGRALTLAVPGGMPLRYDDLMATDARGRALHSWLTLRPGGVSLHVDARGALYPVRIDPLLQQGSKLTGGKEEAGEGWFGFSVALSANGNIALIGGPGDNKFAGAAWVFTRTGGTWSQQGAKLTGSGEVGAAEFGTSVALSGDGSIAVIGGPTDNKDVGAAWVFTDLLGRWSQQGEKLTGKEETGAGEFGYGVALSSDGSTMMIGAPADNKNVGAAWAFTPSGGGWAQQGEKLTGIGEIGAGDFGWKEALSENGNVALIGSFGDNKNVGAAWVFHRSAGIWSAESKLTGFKDEVGEGYFGYSVALSSDGRTALIGGPGDNKFVGAAWVFTPSVRGWSQQGGKFTGKEEIGEGYFGYGVALSSSQGNTMTALIGGPGDNKFVGGAWEFTRSSELGWSERGGKLTGKEETGEGRFGFRVALASEGRTALVGGYSDNKSIGAAWAFSFPELIHQGAKLAGKGEEVGKGEFGASVALSSDGNTALVGAPTDNNEVGAVWVFTRFGGVWTQQGPKLTSTETGNKDFGVNVALSSDGNTALIGGFNDAAAWVFTRSGGVWTQQAKLTVNQEEEVASFGYYVALSSDGNTALVGTFFSGGAWVFTRSGNVWTQQGSKLGSVASKVGLSSDGNTALVGTLVFIRSGGLWTKQGEFSNPFDGFDPVVALSSDGNTAAVNCDGEVCMFTRSAGKWTQQAQLRVNRGGSIVALALSANANVLLIGGALIINVPDPVVGVGWVFTRSGGGWAEQEPLLTGNEIESTVEEGFGDSVALTPDGTTALIGAPNNAAVGAAWPFAGSWNTG